MFITLYTLKNIAGTFYTLYTQSHIVFALHCTVWHTVHTLHCTVWPILHSLHLTFWHIAHTHHCKVLHVTHAVYSRVKHFFTLHTPLIKLYPTLKTVLFTLQTSRCSLQTLHLSIAYSLLHTYFITYFNRFRIWWLRNPNLVLLKNSVMVDYIPTWQGNITIHWGGGGQAADLGVWSIDNSATLD